MKRLAGILLCALASPLAAATFTVTNTADSGAGSLRQAIDDANSAAGTDTIAFDIPGAGVHTITPLSLLPIIGTPLTIDGYTQPGSAPNTNATGALNTVLQIEIDGTGAPNRCITIGANDAGPRARHQPMHRGHRALQPVRREHHRHRHRRKLHRNEAAGLSALPTRRASPSVSPRAVPSG